MQEAKPGWVDLGYARGHKAGYKTGRSDGYGAGREDGYDEGYQAGLSESGFKNPESDVGACNANYSGCLKADASDYDCSGGSGDGPYYTGPVAVLGYDEYGLDADGDGYGCE
jgi:hypothetical protein